MQDHELTRVIDGWARATLRYPDSGDPLDAKLDVRPAGFDTTIGSLAPGESRPREGTRWRTFDVLVSLGLFEDDWTVHVAKRHGIRRIDRSGAGEREPGAPSSVDG